MGRCRWLSLCLLVISLLLVGPVKAVEEENNAVLVEFAVQLSSTEVGEFTLEIHPDWAPLGAARFLELVDTEGFWKGIRFFRVISGFMAQFGIHGKHEVSAVYREMKLKDDPVVESNKRGYISFATSGKDSRTTQMFINLVDNTNLDGMGFSPFGKVIKGMDVVDKIYSGYGEGAPNGRGPDQGLIQDEGNRYLKRHFPNLSYVKSVKRVVHDEVDKAEEL